MKKRVISLVAAAALVAGTLSTAAMAGTVITPGKKTYTGQVYVAEENLKTATSNTPVTFDVSGALDNSTFVYEPTNIPLGTLSNPTISFTLTHGTWNIGSAPTTLGGTPELCVDLASAVEEGKSERVACLTTGDGTNQLVFGGITNGVLTNSDEYVLVWDNTTAVAPVGSNNITVTVDSYYPQIGLTIKAGSSATQQVSDSTDTVTIAEAKPQFSAKVSAPFNAQISAKSGFKTFDTTINPLKNSMTIDISDNTILENAFQDNATYKFVIKATSVAGIDNATVTVDGVANGNCVIDNTSNEIVCDNITGKGIEPQITLTVDNKTVLAQNTFSVEGFAAFNNSSYADRDSSWPLLPETSAGQWTYQGVTAYIPAMFSGSGYETWVNLFVSGGTNTDNTVQGVVTLSDGSLCTIDLGKATPGQKFLISASEIVKKIENDANCKASLYKTDGIYQFPMQINVYTSGQVSGYAVMQNGGAGLTRIPLFSANPQGTGLDSGARIILK